MISKTVSGMKPVRRFPAVSRHRSPTVARCPGRAPDERIRVVRPLLRAGVAAAPLSAPTETVPEELRQQFLGRPKGHDVHQPTRQVN
jgi:hypothetical protein